MNLKEMTWIYVEKYVEFPGMCQIYLHFRWFISKRLAENETIKNGFVFV